jgi:hypothetical protein
MASLLEQHGAIITLDYLPIGQDSSPLQFLHRFQGQSADYALEHGGYAIFEQEADIRGYMAYLLVKGRRGYGVNGWIVRSIEELQAVSLTEGGRFANDYLFAEEIAGPQLRAIRMALNYTEGNLAAINGRLDSWAGVVAARFGLDIDNL